MARAIAARLLEHEAGLIDARRTVQGFKRIPKKYRIGAMNHIAHKLGCLPSWDAIEREIVLRPAA